MYRRAQILTVEGTEPGQAAQRRLIRLESKTPTSGSVKEQGLRECGKNYSATDHLDHALLSCSACEIQLAVGMPELAERSCGLEARRLKRAAFIDR
jgi:hypothetical protein